MKRLRLFTVFHGNLDFSAIPDPDLPRVIAACYWPLLTLAGQARIPLGVEMPARTLQRIAEEDPEWLKSFRELTERGLVEPVASGWSQLIGPLVPADVNQANFELGRAAYARLLGSVPTTWFVSEQTFSAGLVPLYREAGARALVMEWNNPARHRRELRPLRFRSARLGGDGSGDLPLLWNDCIFFQKLQRVAHGAVPPAEYLDAVAGAADPREERLLCAYGGDLEIFDYRPGAPAPAGAEQGTEMGRVSACLGALAADPRFSFHLPRDAAQGLSEGPVVELTSPEDPIPCKKQPRYNPTRWAVSGRNGIGMNTRCFALRRALRAAGRLGDAGPADARERSWRHLVDLWRSDFRTRATEEKVEAFQDRMGAALAAARGRLGKRAPSLREAEDVVLWNPSEQPWSGHPVEVPLRLAPGRLEDADIVSDPPEALGAGAAQLEVHGRYRDGSVRRATLVLEPTLEPGARLGLRLVPRRAALPAEPFGVSAAAASVEPLGASSAAASAEPLGVSADGASARTEAVEAAFLPHRGGALGWARFPDVAPEPMVGSLAHGSFDDVAWSPDFYSGHVVALTEDATKVTDLSPVTRIVPPHGGPVRLTVGFQVRNALGEWTKLYRLYRHHPRLDLVHGLHFQEARVGSLRLGTVTFLPDAFERGTLGYATANGGREIESFALRAGAAVAHHRAVSPSVTASSCLGATEGWVSAGDARRGLAVVGDRSQWAVAPMMEFGDVDDRFFLRIHHSGAESDETRATFLRGWRRVGFALLAHPGALGTVRDLAGCLERGLVYRTAERVGIAAGV